MLTEENVRLALQLGTLIAVVLVGVVQGVSTFLAKKAAARQLENQRKAAELQNLAALATTKAAQAASKAAAEVKASNATTDAKLDTIHAQGAEIHGLVNGGMSIQLQLTATATRRIAELTHDPADAAAAEESQRLLDEHRARQDAVDRTTGGTDPNAKKQ